MNSPNSRGSSSSTQTTPTRPPRKMSKVSCMSSIDGESESESDDNIQLNSRIQNCEQKHEVKDRQRQRSSNRVQRDDEKSESSSISGDYSGGEGERVAIDREFECRQTTLDFVQGLATYPGLGVLKHRHDTPVDLSSGYTDPTELMPDLDRQITVERFLVLLQQVYDYFGGDDLKDKTNDERYKMARIKFPHENPMMIEVERRNYVKVLAEIQINMNIPRMYTALKNNGHLGDVFHKMSVLAYRIKNMGDLVLAVANLTNELPRTVGRERNLYSIEEEICIDMRNMVTINRTPFLRALNTILDHCAAMNLRKHAGSGDVYEPVYKTVNGRERFVHAFRPFGGKKGVRVSDVISNMHFHNRCSVDYISFSSDYGKRVAELIENGNGQHLPNMKINKSLRSFLNGVYDIRADIFYPWGATDFPKDQASAAFYNSKYDERLNLPEYRDPCDHANGKWFQIMETLCPSFHSIIAHQYPKYEKKLSSVPYTLYKEPGACMRFVLAICGRLFFELNEIEREWQHFVAFIGLAGTGKSKVHDLMGRIVPNHVEMKASAGEVVFGSESILDTDLIMVDEICRHTSIPADLMLNVATARGRDGGTYLPIPQKYKKAAKLQVTMPMLLCGNSWPDDDHWPNAEGQTQRRVWGVYFDHEVKLKDTSLATKCETTELSAIITICVRAYQSLIFGVEFTLQPDPVEGPEPIRDINAFVPAEMFHDTMTIVGSSNIVREFLNNGAGPFIVSDRQGAESDKMVPLGVLINEWKHFCEGKDYRKEKRMTKSDFNAIQRITKCRVLKMDEDHKDGEVETLFGEKLPAYASFDVQADNKEPEELFLFRCQLHRTVRCRRLACFVPWARRTVNPVMGAHWPFVDGISYELDSRNSIDCTTDVARTFVVGIELDWVNNPRVRMVNDDLKKIMKYESTKLRIMKAPLLIAVP